MNKDTKLILENQLIQMKMLKESSEKFSPILALQIVKSAKALNDKLLDNPGYNNDIEELEVGGTCPRCGTIGVCADMLEHHNKKKCSLKSEETKQ